MLPETFSCTYRNRLRFEITVKSKVTILRGDSATGKTLFFECITNPDDSTTRSDVVLYKHDPAEDPVEYLKRRKLVRYVFIDENSANKMDRLELLEPILTAGYYMIIATRAPLRNLTYAITDVYELYTENNTVKLRSYYKEYDKLPIAKQYACEDIKSGYQYWRSRLDITPMSGNRSWLNYVKGHCLIVDGAAFGNQIEDVLQYSPKLYAPLSFEYLLLQKYCAVTIEDLMRELEERDKTFERLCSRLAIQYNKLGFKYSKSKLPLRVLWVNLVPELSDYTNKWLVDVFRPEVLNNPNKRANTSAISSFLVNVGFPEVYTEVYSALPDMLDRALWKSQIFDVLKTLGIKELTSSFDD